MADALAAISTRRTPQAEQADPRQQQNNAGGWAFTVDRTARLHRFLTLGVEGGTYYVKAPALARANAQIVLDWAREDAAGLVAEAVSISVAGRAPRNNPALFAVAAALSLGDDAGRKAAAAAVPQVARTGTHLFIFAGYCQQFRGWGRGLRRAVGNWYLGDVSNVAYQVVKYRQREGWTHRDILRQAHPSAPSAAHRALFDFACGRDADLSELPLVAAFARAQAATTAGEWAEIIAANPSVSWEMLPDAALGEIAVWRALLGNGMPQTALMRQLPRLTRLGVLTPMSEMTAMVCGQLASAERLAKARVHPVNVLVALRTYASGHSARGDGTWTPLAPVIDALDAAFYAAYGAVEPAGKRRGIFLDVSGSMTAAAAGLPLSCREASAAMALATMATDSQTMVAGFTAGASGHRYGNWRAGAAITPLKISPRQRLDDAIRCVSDLPFGGTDCSLPMQWALSTRTELDSLEIWTDNETWHGDVHPHQALEQYRQKTGIPARMAVIALTPTEFTIADPADPGSLDVAGMDSAVPRLLADFARGDI